MKSVYSVVRTESIGIKEKYLVFKRLKEPQSLMMGQCRLYSFGSEQEKVAICNEHCSLFNLLVA